MRTDEADGAWVVAIQSCAQLVAEVTLGARNTGIYAAPPSVRIVRAGGAFDHFISTGAAR